MCLLLLLLAGWLAGWLQDTQALNSAQETLSDIFNSQTLEQAEKKIDDLTLNGQVDPALITLMAKAYTGTSVFRWSLSENG